MTARRHPLRERYSPTLGEWTLRIANRQLIVTHRLGTQASRTPTDQAAGPGSVRPISNAMPIGIGLSRDSRTPIEGRGWPYADAYMEYQEATENITRNGTIVAHPRTANPIENPYLKIRDRAAAKLAGMKYIKADFLW